MGALFLKKEEEVGAHLRRASCSVLSRSAASVAIRRAMSRAWANRVRELIIFFIFLVGANLLGDVVRFLSRGFPPCLALCLLLERHRLITKDSFFQWESDAVRGAILY